MTDFALARRNMIDGQLRPNRVTNAPLLAVIGELPRERFLPDAMRSVAYADPKVATSGAFFATMLTRLQIADEVNKKALLFSRGFYVADAVAEGKAEIGNTNMSEMVPNKGVKVIGALPEPFALVTPYVAAVTTTSATASAT